MSAFEMFKGNGDPPMQTQVILVSPDMATRWLEGNTCNRPVRQKKVNEYADQMSRGKWILSPQTISFDKHGVLLDGQHRLKAVVKSGTSIDFNVTLNALRDARPVLDGGLTRDLSDKMTLDLELGHVNKNHVAVLHRMLCGLTTATKTAADVFEEYEQMKKHWSAITFSIDTLGFAKGIIDANMRAAFARAWYSADHAKLIRAAGAIRSGMATNEDESPLVILVRWLTSLNGMRGARGGVFQAERYGKSCRALYAFLHNERISKLVMPSQELFALPD